MKKRLLSAIVAMLIIFTAAVSVIPVSAAKGANHAHDWTYYGNGETLTATCSCGAKASVTIDTEPVYEMARHYYGGAVNYSVIREDGWSDYDDILSYVPLYSGLEIFGADNTALYTDIYERPDTNGTYAVRLAVFENDDPDNGTEIATTNEIPYYLPMTPISECTITEFGPTEIYQGQPESNGSAYIIKEYVNLAWVMQNDPESDMILANDIVANPILVRDDGSVVSARYLVYNHHNYCGNGSYYSSEVFNGSLDGNGYTIYGLYSVNSASSHISFFADEDEIYRSGLFCQLDPTAEVKNLTLDNFYVLGDYAGTIAAMIDSSLAGSKNTGDITVHDCIVLNGYVGPSDAANFENEAQGGLVGNVYVAYLDAGRTIVSDCTSYATVGGDMAGGIVGCMQNFNLSDTMVISDCVNVGSVTGNKAGGIIGEAQINSIQSYTLNISSCKNIGTISGRTAAAGIIGYATKLETADLISSISDTGNTPTAVSQLFISDCTTIGAIYDTKNSGAFYGYIDSGIKAYLTAGSYANAMNVIGTEASGSSYTCLSAPKHIQYSFDNLTALCGLNHTYSPVWELTSVPTCSGSGSMIRKCVVCGTVLDEQSVPTDGHMFEETQVGKEYHNVCVYCGIDEEDAYEDEDDNSQLGSVFAATSGGNMFGVMLIIIALLGVFGGVYAIMKNRKGTEKVLSVILAVGMLGTAAYIPTKAADHAHEWTYTAEGHTITAECSCGAQASVTIDTSDVYEKTRTYHGGEFSYNIIREDGWSDYDDILMYYPAYTGTVIKSPTVEENYEDIYYRPTENGIYNLTLTVYDGNDASDEAGILAQTADVPFYIATISIDNCTISENPPESEPELAYDYGAIYSYSGFEEVTTYPYLITNYAEFIWVARNTVKNAQELRFGTYDKKTTGAVLANDIIANPIVIRDDGTIVSASYTVYQHEGLGVGMDEGDDSQACGFQFFDGQDNTVYGLYAVSTDELGSVGLIDYFGAYATGNTNDCIGYIKNVTVANSYLYGNAAGAICGTVITDNAGYELTEALISNCKSVDCYISGPSAYTFNPDNPILDDWYYKATSLPTQIRSLEFSLGGQGGIVGMFIGLTYGESPCFVDNCTNYSDINGYNAGGIIGQMFFARCDNADGYVSNCINAGTVNGYQCGGIIGELFRSLKYASYNGLVFEYNIVEWFDLYSFKWVREHYWDDDNTGYITFDSCINIGTVKGEHAAGGMTGHSEGMTTDEDYYYPIIDRYVSCISAGCVYKLNNSNPFVGLNYDSYIYASYSVGTWNDSFDFSGIILNRTYDEICDMCRSLGHIPSAHWVAGDAPTCSGIGTMSNICLLCGETLETQSTPCYSHSFESTTDFEGETVYHCVNCGLSKDKASTVSTKMYIPSDTVIGFISAIQLGTGTYEEKAITLATIDDFEITDPAINLNVGGTFCVSLAIKKTSDINKAITSIIITDEYYGETATINDAEYTAVGGYKKYDSYIEVFDVNYCSKETDSKFMYVSTDSSLGLPITAFNTMSRLSSSAEAVCDEYGDAANISPKSSGSLYLYVSRASANDIAPLTASVFTDSSALFVFGCAAVIACACFLVVVLKKTKRKNETVTEE